MHLENSISGRYSIIKVPLFALCRLKLCLQHNRQCVHKCINQFVDLFFGQFGIVLKDRTEHLQQHLQSLHPLQQSLLESEGERRSKAEGSEKTSIGSKKSSFPLKDSKFIKQSPFNFYIIIIYILFK